MRYYIIFSIISLSIVAGCKKQSGSPEYINSIMRWHEKRIAGLKSETGWLNLAGLYWLNKGENTFGSAKDNDIIFPPDAPAQIGVLVLNEGTVTAIIKPGVEVFKDSIKVEDIILQDALSNNTTVLRYNSLRWFIINRNGKYGVRLRDINAPLVKEFKGIETYPIDEKWKVEATFVPYPSPKVIEIQNIIGSVEEDTVEGKLAFKIEGKDFTLDPVSEGNELFIIFADETNSNETYGAGRFLYADKPDSSGLTIIDFNKAYNPPCAFTKYATCPLPPKQNYLHLKITAGEKKYGDH